MLVLSFVQKLPFKSNAKSHNGAQQIIKFHLFLLDSSFNLFGCGFVRSEQTDSAGEIWIQNIPIFISHYQIQV